MMLNQIDRIIAVVGCQRSGTTLTGQLLGADPKAVLIDEWDGLYPWFHAVAEGAPQEPALQQRMLKKAIKKYVHWKHRFSESDGAYHLHPAINTLILKAPNLTFEFDKLAAFPVPVSIVYPVRDIRAVAVSMNAANHIDFIGNQLKRIDIHPELVATWQKERDMMADQSISKWARYAALWRIKSSLKRNFQNKALPVFQFRYEDLVSAPQVIISELAEFCGFEEKDALPRAHEVYLGEGPGGTDRQRPVDPDSLLLWQSSLETSDESLMMEIADKIATNFGYAKRNERP